MAMSAVELAQRLDISIPQVEKALANLKAKGLVCEHRPESGHEEDLEQARENNFSNCMGALENKLFREKSAELDQKTRGKE